MSVTGTHGMAERRTGFAEDDGEWGVPRSERWKEDGREGPRPTEHMRRHSCMLDGIAKEIIANKAD
jgi:hypothetical protein